MPPRDLPAIRKAAAESAASGVSADYLLPAHVRLQRRRDRDGAVVPLEVLEERDHRAADRQPGAIQGVDRLRASPSPWPARRPIARLHALRLERPAIRAA